MSNFSKLIDRFDRLFLYYTEKVIGTFDKPTRKFYIDAVYGILKGQSVLLSDIAHALSEKITPKKTIERISRFLSREYDLDFRNGLLSLAISMMPKSELKVFSVDDTDVSKPYGKCFESLGRVRDASSPDGAIGNGYKVSCITALAASSKHPMPVYDVFHSETKPGYLSANTYTFEGIDFVSSHRQYFVIRARKKQEDKGKGGEGRPDQRGKEEEGKDTHTLYLQGEQACREGVASQGEAA